MNIATQAAQIGLDWDTRTGAVTVPIYQTATFRHPGLGQSTGFDYTRSGNPTRQLLEEAFKEAPQTSARKNRQTERQLHHRHAPQRPHPHCP